jgi:hypothetical protein
VFTADAGGDEVTCHLELSRGAVAIATFDAGACSFLWDGRGRDGWLVPGAVTATASLHAGADVLATSTVSLDVVRVGISEVGLAAEPAGARVPLLYAETDGVLRGYHELAANQPPWRLGALDDADGPRMPPPIWTDVKSPPLDDASPDGIAHETYNVPSALVAGASAELAVVLAGSVASGEIQIIAPPGVEPATQPFVVGESVRFRTVTSPVPAVGRYDVSFDWRFAVKTEQGELITMPGAITTSHRFYGMVGQPALGYPNLPHRAWINVVDAIATRVSGASADSKAVAGVIVDHVFKDLGLTYERQGGAAAYVEWLVDDRSSAAFDLAQFQRRGFGTVVNCADAAAVVSTYATMIGIDLRYHILRRPDLAAFDLNFIRVIGSTIFDDTPFADGRGAFRYHAVVGPADGSFFDATLELDGDGAPASAPHTALLARGMTRTAYLSALSSEPANIGVFYDQKMRLK